AGSPAGPSLALLAAATGCAATALFAPDLLSAYGGATLASAAAWAAAALDRGVGPAGLRAAGRWLLALLVGDLGLLAAGLGIGGEIGLVVAALPRLALFPFQPLALAAARLPGRIEFGLALVAALLGVDLLGRALVLAAGREGTPIGPWLLAAALATALAAAPLLGRARGYRSALARTLLIDAAHVAAGLALATPLGLAAALLYGLDAALARTTLLAIADATSQRGGQVRRLPDGPALIPFALGFGALTGMPPQPGFVARWLLYLALFRAGAGLAVIGLAVAAALGLAVVLREIGRLGPPAQPRLAARPLLIGLALLWVPLGLFVVAPIVVLDQLIAPIAALIWPGQALALGLGALLGLPGALALLVAGAVVVGGFAGYLGRGPAGPLARALGSGALAPARGAIEAVAGAGLPLGLLDGLAVLVADGARLLLAPWEARFQAVGAAAVVLAMLLLALG
ncbi:MAG TPA: hypothetical protein VGL23_13540, partial [Chloroflexota bacterium]